MWKYVKKYLALAIVAALFMVGEVLMDLLQPSMMRRIVDEGVLGVNNGGVSDLNLILNLGILMIVLVLSGGFFGSMNNVFVNITTQNIGNNIRKDCFRRIMDFSFAQMNSFGVGSLITRVTNDITQVQGLISRFIRGMVRTFMLTFGSLYFMFRLNVTFGHICLAAMPFMVAIIVICLKRADPWFVRLQKQLDTVNSTIQENISGIRIIKACVRELYEKVRFKKENDELIRSQLKALFIFSFSNPATTATMYGVATLILFSGAKQVEAGAVTPGAIMAAITYTTQLLNGVSMLVMTFQNISRGLVSLNRLKEVLNSEPEQKGGSYVGTASGGGSIEFRKVSFAFPGSGQIVLKDINLKIEAGESVAIMGSTGSGKTALVSLIPAFYEASDGEILLDGVNVKEYDLKALRDRVSFCLQKSELFAVPISENILWGNPEADAQGVTAAAEIAQADDFIRRTPNGYDTVVAERGSSLSGGQKQRIAISRAVLKEAEIMIFDDSSSALDLKTEADLYNALVKARPEATKIFVVQRIASARRAGRIIILNNGSIEASGTHDELMQSSATYRDIYRSQMGEGGENLDRQ